MIAQWFSDIGPWSWMVIGVALLALEVMSPGVYLLWFGVAAILTGLLSFQLWDFAFWGWQMQVLAFLILSLASVLIGRRLFPATGTGDTDQPLLNQRDRQLVGRLATLTEPIVNGHGRVRIGDTLWRVTGEDMAEGTRVRVVAAENGELRVEAA
jgi:membrane protein implicated in regulation of membrane protease activity